jgi:hypothetical protein
MYGFLTCWAEYLCWQLFQIFRTSFM